MVKIQGDFFLMAKSKQLLLYHKTRLLHKNLYPHNHNIGTFGRHMRTNDLTFLHAHWPCSKSALFSSTQGWALLTQQCCWNDIALTKSSDKPVYRRLQGFLTYGTKCSYYGSTPYAGKKVTGCDFHWTDRGMHHASRALLHIFSYLECCFW